MENQASSQAPGTHQTRAQLIAQIHQSRARLEETLRGLSERQMTTPGPDGWSVKDHLSHMATWELGISELLRKRDRFAAMQISEAVAQQKSEQEINDLIVKNHAGLNLQEVINKFQDAHRQMMETLNTLTEEDLYRPYNHYAPVNIETKHGPIINWVIGNTSGHFDEHERWIRSLVEALG